MGGLRVPHSFWVHLSFQEDVAPTRIGSWTRVRHSTHARTLPYGSSGSTLRVSLRCDHNFYNGMSRTDVSGFWDLHWRAALWGRVSGTAALMMWDYLRLNPYRRFNANYRSDIRYVPQRLSMLSAPATRIPRAQSWGTVKATEAIHITHS